MMTKQAHQKELQEKVKPGIKPSHLKRSKSLSDIPAVPESIPLKRTASQPALKQPNLAKQIEQLKQELVFSQQTAHNYLTNLQKAIAELDQKEQQLDSVNQD
jgi:hypothetical protein